MIVNLLIAGFGGQGVLFAGKIIANAGMIDQKQVSWLPSYGPEMRGGTCNCSVCVDDKPIGCPIVLTPSMLMVMNRPSFDKFIDTVVPNGNVVYDSTLIDAHTDRKDIGIHPIPATKMANDNGLHGLANIIVLGQLLKVTNFTTFDVLAEAVKKCIPARKAHLTEPNLKALKMGYDYQG